MNHAMRNVIALLAALVSPALAQSPSPYPPSPVVAEFQIDWSTHQRHAPGSDNWPMTWADDGHLYAAWGDGGGFGGTNSDGRASLGVARVTGDWAKYRGENIWGGKNSAVPATFGGKSYGILCVDGALYMWWAPDTVPFLQETRLVTSRDHGRTWQPADWAWTFEDGLTMPTFVNFGRNYAGARDDYVYSYYIRPSYGPGKSKSPLAYESGLDVHRPGAMYLSRVPKDRILDRSRYEFFAGLDEHGGPRWTRQVDAKQPVFTDPNGVGWNVSVSYNAGLGRYLLATEHSRSHQGHFGLFDAPEPWGPWSTVLYEDDWGAGHIPVNTFCWSFPTKWFSEDGQNATLVFSGREENDSLNTVRGRFIRHENRFDWQTATPESQGMSTARLDALRDEIASKTKALLVIRHDRIVYEWYPEDRTAADQHYTASMAKGIVGGMSLAVAMHDGRIQLDDRVAKYIPQWSSDPRKASITVRHLGSHTSGLDDAEADGLPHEKLTGWKGDFWKRFDPPNDPFTISRDITPLLFEPGRDFQYSNPGIAMLSYVVTAALKDAPIKDVRTLLRERILRPIGASDADWSLGYNKTFTVDGLPLVAAWGGGNFTPRTVARIGRLVLRGGDWDGRRLLSADVVRQVTRDAGLPGNCGMGWWTNAGGRHPTVPRDAVWAAGAGDQILLVVPSLDLIMVRNGAELPDRSRTLFAKLMEAVVEKSPQSQKTASQAPYPPSAEITGIELDWSTHERHAQGSDNFQLTWADDDHQYGAWGDGGGFGGTNGDGRADLGFARIEGDWNGYRGFNVWGGKNAENPAQFKGKSWGTICVGGILYSWIVPDAPDGEPPRDHYRNITLARSTDHAATWTKADWQWRIEDDLIIPTFLVFGKDNAGARDEYVYSYFLRPQSREVAQSTHGLEIHRPGAVYLARVHKDHIFGGRDHYEWFTGLHDGKPTWGTLSEKRPVFEDPNGTGWCLSASYNPGLGRYLLATEHTASHSGVMGLFDAPEPWGPWTTVKYWTPTDRFGETRPGSSLPWKHNVFFFSFAPKWLSDDGRTFTLVFTGGGRGNDNDSFNTVRGRFLP